MAFAARVSTRHSACGCSRIFAPDMEAVMHYLIEGLIRAVEGLLFGRPGKPQRDDTGRVMHGPVSRISLARMIRSA